MRRLSPGIALLLASLACLRMAHAAGSIRVEVAGVDGALRENVLALSSLKRHAESKQLDQEMVERLAQRAPGEAQKALRPFGYYEPQVGTELTRTAEGWRARITIDPGKPVILVEQQVEITGSGRDERFLKQVLARSPLRTGARLSHPDYDLLKGELLRAAAGHGYLDATFTRAELIVDPAAREARAHVTLDTGLRYRFGPTTIEQDFLKEGLVRRYLRYREGDWYDAGALLRTQFALDDSQYFAVVEVLPEERDRENRIAPIRIVSRTQQAQPLHDRRRIRDRHARPRHARLGGPAAQPQRPPLARGDPRLEHRGIDRADLRDPVDRPGAREARIRTARLS